MHSFGRQVDESDVILLVLELTPSCVLCCIWSRLLLVRNVFF